MLDGYQIVRRRKEPGVWKIPGIVLAALIALVVAACGGITSSYGRAVDSGTFIRGIPAGHHEYYSQYHWYVGVDPDDEDWEFYADIKPHFEQNGQVICIVNALEVTKWSTDGDDSTERDRIHPGEYCVAGNGGQGEGKVRIIEQTDPDHPAVTR